ncbi:tRNA adenosine(34) deaminase TadA [Desulfolithobacter sp.]
MSSGVQKGYPGGCSEYTALMRLAIARAGKAAALGEVPVGAVLVGREGEILAAAGNNCIQAHDPAGHAEMRALRQAAKKIGNYRLPGTTMVVTLEPCAMCAAALVHARVERVVFGAHDPKAGALVSKYRIGSDGLLNHCFAITGGVLGKECGQLLKNFFRSRR